MLAVSPSSSRACSPAPPPGSATSRRKPVGKYRGMEADTMSRCDSIMTDTSTSSRWSRGFRFRRNTGSIRSTTSTMSSRQKLTQLFKRLALRLGVGSNLSSYDLSMESQHSVPTSSAASVAAMQLDDISIRWGSTSRRYGGAGVSNIRPSGPRRMQSDDAAAVWANVIAKHAHTTKGSAQARAFRHLLQERDDARAECVRLKSSVGKQVPNGTDTLGEIGRICGDLKVALSSFKESLPAKDAIAAPDTTVAPLEAIYSRLEELTQALERVIEPQTNNEPTKPVIRKPSAKPTAPSPRVSRQSSVRTLADTAQATRIPTPASQMHTEQGQDLSNAPPTEQPPSQLITALPDNKTTTEDSDTFARDLCGRIEKVFAGNENVEEAAHVVTPTPKVQPRPPRRTRTLIVRKEREQPDGGKPMEGSDTDNIKNDDVVASTS
ncbi:uncharacterized protein SPPG_02280 [Spizellomyces punctatus DAOM BR117]|uniref:Uncharacterized protein n=1 Tax=Spizellomyces punctatus (strain DAOM BR117) TaxID=645134 RepID=A0A0L0HP95_SPIPD|nr:uncharacterized protein SPPG_02280 [Spizellomyces punctatus DAOM BR117]KND03226.1 hypothetical protein SPPG_02280 [Spizellomyces punctatus DAOM BR117]|eukprot:XP_016611265.1 hypothetical protein SPPG_02280 [Spizellomyces punctatus DAOM BR117]